MVYCLITEDFFIVVDVNYVERGAGFWKFNTLLLQDGQFLKEMNNEIDKSLQSLALKQPMKRWEMIKERIKKVAIRYARSRGSENNLVISQLSEIINNLEETLPLDKKQNELLENSKLELEEKMYEKIGGSMFRSKVRWYEQGEKSTKYFFSLEKARYNAKACYCIVDEYGKIVYQQDEILQVQQRSYKDLYSEDKDVAFTLQNHSSIKVSIKVFWTKLKQPFMEMVEQVYKDKLLHDTARQGILNLIPKPNKDSRLVKNLRPITLLNVDYKIIEKAVANKMIPALEHIIHSDQRGFMKNRRISVNIRKMLDIIQYAKEQDIEALILSLGFRKVF